MTQESKLIDLILKSRFSSVASEQQWKDIVSLAQRIKDGLIYCDKHRTEDVKFCSKCYEEYMHPCCNECGSPAKYVDGHPGEYYTHWCEEHKRGKLLERDG